jgi:hypothetical protein
MWPDKRAAIKPVTMTMDQMDLVMNVCFFFSNSEGSGTGYNNIR